MPQVNIFQWRDGAGWIVLSGGGMWESEDNLNIHARILGRTVSQGPIAYIWAASDIETADHHMDVLRDLGARTGYLVDILTEQEDVLFQQLSEAGVIILGDGPNSEALREALVGVGQRGIEEAFRQGATIYAIGQSAVTMSAYQVQGNQLVPGFNWLANAIVMPDYDAGQADGLRDLVQQLPASYGLGMGQGAALALGPYGEVEVWGNTAITVSLSHGYSHEEE
jgi:hypothetical protein